MVLYLNISYIFQWLLLLWNTIIINNWVSRQFVVDLLNTFIMKLYECRMLSEAKKRTHSKWFKNKHLKSVRSYLEEGLDFKFLFSFGWFSLTFWKKYGCTSLIFLNMKSEGRKKRKKKYLFEWPYFNSKGKSVCQSADFPQFSLARIVSDELP